MCIETGRYENIDDRKGILAHEHTCLVCGGQDVEDEYHFLLKCPVYASRRVAMINVFKEVSEATES